MTTESGEVHHATGPLCWNTLPSKRTKEILQEMMFRLDIWKSQVSQVGEDCYRHRRLLPQGLCAYGFLWLESSALFSPMTNFSLPSSLYSKAIVSLRPSLDTFPLLHVLILCFFFLVFTTKMFHMLLTYIFC